MYLSLQWCTKGSGPKLFAVPSKALALSPDVSSFGIWANGNARPQGVDKFLVRSVVMFERCYLNSWQSTQVDCRGGDLWEYIEWDANKLQRRRFSTPLHIHATTHSESRTVCLSLARSNLTSDDRPTGANRLVATCRMIGPKNRCGLKLVLTNAITRPSSFVLCNDIGRQMRALSWFAVVCLAILHTTSASVLQWHGIRSHALRFVSQLFRLFGVSGPANSDTNHETAQHA